MPIRITPQNIDGHLETLSLNRRSWQEFDRDFVFPRDAEQGEFYTLTFIPTEELDMGGNLKIVFPTSDSPIHFFRPFEELPEGAIGTAGVGESLDGTVHFLDEDTTTFDFVIKINHEALNTQPTGVFNWDETIYTEELTTLTSWHELSTSSTGGAPGEIPIGDQTNNRGAAGIYLRKTQKLWIDADDFVWEGEEVWPADDDEEVSEAFTVHPVTESDEAKLNPFEPDGPEFAIRLVAMRGGTMTDGRGQAPPGQEERPGHLRLKFYIATPEEIGNGNYTDFSGTAEMPVDNGDRDMSYINFIVYPAERDQYTDANGNPLAVPLQLTPEL